MGLQSSDIILVERSNTLYRETYGNRANIDSSDLLLVERGGTLYKCTYADFSSATGTDRILVEANSTTGGRVVGKMYQETQSEWAFPSAYADIHSANYMVTLGTLLYGQANNNTNNFSVVETQVEVSSSSSNAKGNLFIGFRNSAGEGGTAGYSYYGDLPIAAVQVLHADGTTFRDTNEFLLDFNFGQAGGLGVNGRYWWMTTESTNTSATAHPNTYSYEDIDDTRTKRQFSHTVLGTISSSVGADYGIPTSTYDSDGGTVLAVGNQNISQSTTDGYIFSECSSSSTGDIVWLMLVNTGYIYNGDRIRICYFGGGNGLDAARGLQTTNSLYLRFEED